MDRATIQGYLQKTEEHIAEGEQHIRRQRQIVEELARDGHDAELARELLATLEQLQRTHLDTRDRLTEMLQELG